MLIQFIQIQISNLQMPTIEWHDLEVDQYADNKDTILVMWWLLHLQSGTVIHHKQAFVPLSLSHFLSAWYFRACEFEVWRLVWCWLLPKREDTQERVMRGCVRCDHNTVLCTTQCSFHNFRNPFNAQILLEISANVLVEMTTSFTLIQITQVEKNSIVFLSVFFFK